MRFGKLTREEEQFLGNQLLDLDEKYFSIQKIQLDKFQKQFIESGKISICSKCKELYLLDLENSINGEQYCKSCRDESYYTLP